MKEKRYSVFRRLISLFVVIELAVLVVVGALLFRYARVQEETERAMREETATQALEQVEEQIQAAYGLTESLVKDSRLSRIAYQMYPDNYERSQIVLNILDSISSSDELNASIDAIEVTFPPEGTSLSSVSGYNSDVPYQASRGEKLSGSLLFRDGALKVYVPQPLIADLIGEIPDYDCTVSISNRYLRSVLTVFGENEDQGAVLLFLKDDGTVLSPLDGENDGVNRLLLEKVSEIGLRELGETVDLSGHRYALNSQISQNYPIALLSWRNTDALSANITFTLVSLILVVLLSGTLFFLMIWQTDRQVARPLYQLMKAFDRVANGALDTRIHHDKNDEFDFLYDSFNTMTAQTEQLIEDIKEQHSLLQNAELMQLQAQIDPHFLYNSFNIIKYMANGEEYEQITQFVSALAQYYRFINKETRQAIPLAAEIQHMETYLYIQQTRFEERIHVEVKGLTQDVTKYLVPKLILQPLIENCYAHGLKNKLEDGVIAVTFSKNGRTLLIQVEDNGEEIDAERLTALQESIRGTDDRSVSHALANIRRRLELAYGEPDLLDVSIGALGGLCVTLRFDLDKRPSNLT